jgi:hypothetical protein
MHISIFRWKTSPCIFPSKKKMKKEHNMCTNQSTRCIVFLRHPEADAIPAGCRGQGSWRLKCGELTSKTLGSHWKLLNLVQWFV